MSEDVNKEVQIINFYKGWEKDFPNKTPIFKGDVIAKSSADAAHVGNGKRKAKKLAKAKLSKKTTKLGGNLCIITKVDTDTAPEANGFYRGNHNVRHCKLEGAAFLLVDKRED